MLITVIMPVFNAGRYLAEAIASVLTQDYAEVELLVKDNCSTDDSANAQQAWGHDPRLKWIRSPDTSLGEAVNQALKLAQGEVVNWLGGDDLLLPGSLGIVAGALQRHPDRQWLYGAYQIIDGWGQVRRPMPAASFSLDRLLRGNYIACQATFVRRQALLDVGQVSPGLEFGMDYDLWLRLGRRHSPLVIQERLAAFRLHPAGKTGRHPLSSELEGARVALGHARRPGQWIQVLTWRMARLAVAGARSLVLR